MKRRDLLKSALLAIPGVGWLAGKAKGSIEPLAPKPLEFASVYASPVLFSTGVSWPEYSECEVRRGVLLLEVSGYRDGKDEHGVMRGFNRGFTHSLSVRYPTGVPIPLTFCEYQWFHLRWDENEWWIIWFLRADHEHIPIESFANASTNPNYVIIDPFSK